jgi:competence protein ComER
MFCDLPTYGEKKVKPGGVILLNIGFIGTGSMGSLLIEAFIRSGACVPKQIFAHNRTRAKVERLACEHPGLHISKTNVDVALSSDLVFLCVKPSEFKNVLPEISPYVRETQIIISITSPVSIHDLEHHLPCKIAKVIPSITHSVFSGPSLCMFGTRMTSFDRKLVEALMSHISAPREINERYTRISSDLTSCSPAFVSFILAKMVEAAEYETGIAKEDAVFLVSHMVAGLGKLLTEGVFTLESLQKRVSVPGGITADGLNLLDQELKDVFNKLFQVTHAKYEEDIAKVRNALYGQKID